MIRGTLPKRKNFPPAAGYRDSGLDNSDHVPCNYDNETIPGNRDNETLPAPFGTTRNHAHMPITRIVPP